MSYWTPVNSTGMCPRQASRRGGSKATTVTVCLMVDPGRPGLMNVIGALAPNPALPAADTFSGFQSE